jgi:hypothetical protein
MLLAFRGACEQHGVPASTLTGNGMVFTTRLSGGRGGRNGLEHELRRLGITQKNGKPNHPQTQGKAGTTLAGAACCPGAAARTKRRDVSRHSSAPVHGDSPAPAEFSRRAADPADYRARPPTRQ